MLMYNQLVLNYKHKVFFCLVEKNGNTNVRMMFLIAAGLVPATTSTETHMQFAEHIRRYHSRIVSGHVRLNKGETIESLLPQYFKMTMVRQPLERLLSAYRDKIEGVIQRVVTFHAHANRLKKRIFKTFHPQLYEQWVNDKSIEYRIPFREFIQYVIDKPNAQLDVHFRPVINLCNPCMVKYNFYGFFNHFIQDTQILVTKLGTKLNEIPGANQGSNSTAILLNSYYSQLSQDLKEQLFRDWYKELEFYYYLYPEERNSHKSILNIDEDIPVDLTTFS